MISHPAKIADLRHPRIDAPRLPLTLIWLRDYRQFLFWYPTVETSFTAHHLNRFLGYGRNDKLDVSSVAKVLAHHSPMQFRTFQVTWRNDDDQSPSFSVALKDKFEWTDVVTEAWEGLQRPEWNLSEPGGKLLVWAQQDKNQNQWLNKSALGRQAQLRGTSWASDFIADLFKEIQSKANIGLKVEQKDDEFRVSFEEPSGTVSNQRHGPLNPVLALDFKKIDYAQLDLFRETLYDWILSARLPADGAELGIWQIQDRVTLSKCFPNWQSQAWRTSTLVDFLSQVALDHGLLWGYSFRDPEPWTYVCCPKQGLTWDDVGARIRKARSLPPITKQYGISAEAAALVKWFTTLREKEWLGSLTPPVEEHLKHRIGISTDWHGENLGTYLSMLVEEISEKTEWKVTVHFWAGGWHGARHRLLVKHKPTSFEEVVQHIQMLAIRRGKLLARETVEAAVRAVLE